MTGLKTSRLFICCPQRRCQFVLTFDPGAVVMRTLLLTSCCGQVVGLW